MNGSVAARPGARAAAAALALAAALVGCQGEVTPADGQGGAVPSTTTTLHPNAPPLPGESECKVVINTGIKVPQAKHVPVCTPVRYATNPPSGGDHWPIWAAFKRYQAPVPREIYVHDLEHGAVVLSYRCASPCPDVTAMLERVRTGAAPDRLCRAIPGGPPARLVMTPDPELPTPVAASAWGATYTATCLDEPSLAAFVAGNYAKGTENFCSAGIDLEDPNSGAPRCAGGGLDGGAPDGDAPDSGVPDGDAPDSSASERDANL